MILATLALMFAVQCPDGTPPPCNARAAAPPRMSVAVLDFENLSRDTNDTYLGQGIAGELTSRLGQVGRLQVTSRSAVRRLRNPAAMRLAELGRELNAAYLVNGTVQRSGSRLRVTAELLRAGTGAQVWSDQFDRSDSDLLVIQEQVAVAVASAVTGRLLPAEQATLAARPTRNPDAYAAYLRGKALTNSSLSFEGQTTAIRLLERAVALDSQFVDAWGELSAAHASLYWTYFDRSEARLEQARRAAERAAAIDPQAAMTHVAKGYYYYWGRREYTRALQEFSIAAQREPRNADVQFAMANVARRQGDFERAVALRSRGLDLDPGNASELEELGNTLGYLRRFDQAIAALDRVLTLDPTLAGSPYAFYVYVAADGDARRAPHRAAAVASDPATLAATIMKDPANAWPLIRLAPELQSAILMAAPPADTSSRIGYFLAVGRVLQLQGRPGDAGPAFDSARVMLEAKLVERPYDANFHSAMSVAWAGLARCDDARREGERATELLPVEGDALNGSQFLIVLAEVEAQCGLLDQAAVRVEYLLSRPAQITRTLFRVDPVWAPLHGTPRYQRIIAGH